MIREQWEGYRRNVMPTARPAIQIIESRRAFYAGAQAALGLMLELSEDSVTLDDGADRFQALLEECAAFGAHVGAGGDSVS